MFEEYQICPYTGLRSFTEEESLYFKGREEHIEQATEQLQRNKFLMLTGASGDGKSSLVYAGIVPNARAGFLKSRYTQWKVADFRPERTPFANLCKSLARQLEINSTDTVEAELQHGFSALVDLYKNSSSYVDEDSIEWQQADESAKAAIKRKAANLIIIVDQFEEFFTNPENYHAGAPSSDSNLVLNILLETARIALEEGLPIYVVFTMRSDYIGQCAAFRSLPEYIGFSQFFVPRLNRIQLTQVIEEPAVLSGNKISRRLSERLIHDIAEGVDQLPILQHALNQIWHAANQGKDEMDLLHYAMVGGMSSDELPDDQLKIFNVWFKELPEKIKHCYQAPNLQNVLDTHANKLYESAAENFKIIVGGTLSEAIAKRVIRTTFACLTKIDQSRAVRNRMTLHEITNIIGSDAIGVDVVAGVLHIFRQPGNTFVRPFITDDASLKLEPDAVLDITHESLIRNWELLEKWAGEEFDNYTIYLDFEQQLNRWVDSGKKNGFLLSIGPLTYFENWYNKVKPNAYWIARYLPEDVHADKKLIRAKQILSTAQEFIERSASKHVVTRMVMKYGPGKIAAVLAVIALITFSSFAVRNYIRQQNSYVLKSIHEQTLQLANDPKIGFAEKISLIVEELRLGQTSVGEVVKAVDDTYERIGVSTGIATFLVFQGTDQPQKEIFESLAISDSLLESVTVPKNGVELSSLLKALSDLRSTLELAYYYNADQQILEWKKRNAKRSAKWSLHVLRNKPFGFEEVQKLTIALENGINYRMFSESEADELIAILSPLEGNEVSLWIKDHFHRDKLLIRGSLEYGFKFNGLYQQLAYLYASKGNSEKALQCIDSLLKYSQNNYQGDYSAGIDNAGNIAAVYFLSGHDSAIDDFVEGYCKKAGINEELFYNRVINRMLHSNATLQNLRLLWWMGVNSNLNIQFSSRELKINLFRKYRDVVKNTITNTDERYFLMALSYKNEGVLKHLNKEPIKSGESTIDQSFDSAMEYFSRVSKNYLDQTLTIIGVAGSDQAIATRRYLFSYPDIRTIEHPLEPRGFFFFYSTDVWMKYILDHDLFDYLYPRKDELEAISSWLYNYNAKLFAKRGFLSNEIHPEVLQRLESRIINRPEISLIDFNQLYLFLGYYAQQAGDNEAMVAWYSKLNPGNFFNILRTKEYGNNVNNQSFRTIAYAIQGFVKEGQLDQAMPLINIFKKPMNRSSLYAFIAAELQREKWDDKNLIQQMIDSAYAELNRVENLATGQPNRQVLAYALALQDPEVNVSEANNLIKNINAKIFAMERITEAFAFRDNLYGAQYSIPSLISKTDQANFLSDILIGYMEGNVKMDERWRVFSESYVANQHHWIFYIDEND